MPASFVTYKRPQGLMQDCLRHWAESQYWCQKWDLNHSWLGPVLNLRLCHWMSQISQSCLAGEAPWTERRTVATCWFSRVRVGVSNHRWGPLAGPQCSVRSRWDRGVPVTVGEVAVSLQGRGQLGRLAGLGEILLAVGQGCLAGRGGAGPGELLLAVGGGI